MTEPRGEDDVRAGPDAEQGPATGAPVAEPASPEAQDDPRPFGGDAAGTADLDAAGTADEAPAGVADETEVDEIGQAQAEIDRAQADVAALTADLQRLQAEYLNYKRRVDRDRELIRQNATYRALAPITEVLDTIDRAREHGPLDEGLRAVADQLERAVAGQGLTRFGKPGDAFDPTIHEALSHIGEDPDVEVTTCKLIAKAGYRIGDRVVRAAQVLVVDPVAGRPQGIAGQATDGAPETLSGESAETPSGGATTGGQQTEGPDGAAGAGDPSPGRPAEQG